MSVKSLTWTTNGVDLKKKKKTVAVSSQDVAEDTEFLTGNRRSTVRTLQLVTKKEVRKRKEEEDQRATKLNENTTAVELRRVGRKERRSLSPRLPPHELPTFDGNGDWLRFWSIFQVCVGKQKIENEEKLLYLLSCLQGEAMDIVKGFDLNDEAYGLVLKTLEDEYGGVSLSTRLFHELHDFPRAEETTSSAHSMVHNMNRIIKQLIDQGEDVNHGFVKTVVYSKLPSFLLEDVLHEEEKKKEGFTMERLLEYLKNEIWIRRRVEEISGEAYPVSFRDTTRTKEKSRMEVKLRKDEISESSVYKEKTTLYVPRPLPSSTTSATIVFKSTVTPSSSTSISLVCSATVAYSSVASSIVLPTTVPLVCTTTAVPFKYSTPSRPVGKVSPSSIVKSSVCSDSWISLQQLFSKAWRVLVVPIFIFLIISGHTSMRASLARFNSPLSLVGHGYDDPGGPNRTEASMSIFTPHGPDHDDLWTLHPMPDSLMRCNRARIKLNQLIDPG